MGNVEIVNSKMVLIKQKNSLNFSYTDNKQACLKV